MLKPKIRVLELLNERETKDEEKLERHKDEIWVVVMSQFTKRRLGARAFSGRSLRDHAMKGKTQSTPLTTNPTMSLPTPQLSSSDNAQKVVIPRLATQSASKKDRADKPRYGNSELRNPILVVPCDTLSETFNCARTTLII